MARYSLSIRDVTAALDGFTPADLWRGRAYLSEGRVVSLARRAGGPAFETVTAAVRGTRSTPYAVSVLFNASGGLVDCKCSCPVGAFCKHAVAALMSLRASLPGSPAPTPTAAAPVRGGDRGSAMVSEPERLRLVTPSAPRVPPAPPAVANWAKALAAAAKPRATSANVARPYYLLVYPTSTGRVALVVEPRAVGDDGVARPPRRSVGWQRAEVAVELTAADRRIQALIGPSDPRGQPLPKAPDAALLVEMVGTSRAVLGLGEEGRPLTAGPPRAGVLAFASNGAGVASPVVRVEGEDDVLVLPFLPPHYVDAAGTCGRIDVPEGPEVAAEWLNGPPIAPAAAAQAAEVLRAAGLPAPRVRRLREIAGAPRAVLCLESGVRAGRWGAAPSGSPRAWVKVAFDYDGVRFDADESGDVRVTDEEVLTVRRSSKAELECIEALTAGGLRPFSAVFSSEAPPPGLTLTLAKSPPFALARRIAEIATPSMSVEMADDYAFRTEVAEELQVTLADDEGGLGRFDVTVGVRVGGETVSVLPLLLEALERDNSTEDAPLYVALDDGRTLEVPAARIAPLRALLLELAATGPGVSAVRALGIDPAVLARSPKSLEKLRAALASTRRAAVPRSLRATLRDYQRDGYAWLMARRRACLGAVLADDMGLGKTVQTLALLLAEDRGGRPSLVVCPRSVLGNWREEAARFAPSLQVHVHHGLDRAARAETIPKADVVLTTYAILVRDADLFAAQSFSTVVLDEAQVIKNGGSTYTRAACSIDAEFRLALSGTPMENHLGELWSVMRFVLPELFGDSRSFARSFRRPIERDPASPARAELVRRIAPFLLRRRKEEVARELPDKTVVVEHVELDDAQRDVYETVRASMDQRVRAALAEKGLARSQIVILDALLKLRQSVCDPRLLPGRRRRAPSAKLEALVEKLEELVAEGRRVLVFSQFVTMLELIENELTRAKIPYLVLTGQTTRRDEVVASFQAGDVPVFLLSLKAGGTGLNLTAADVVIHYDPWWNPAAEAQATDRAHRIGQNKPVFVYKLVGKDTIEEKILALQEKKKALFASVFDDGANVGKALSAEDVAFLFER